MFDQLVGDAARSCLFVSSQKDSVRKAMVVKCGCEELESLRFSEGHACMETVSLRQSNRKDWLMSDICVI